MAVCARDKEKTAGRIGTQQLLKFHGWPEPEELTRARPRLKPPRSSFT